MFLLRCCSVLLDVIKWFIVLGVPLIIAFLLNNGYAVYLAGNLKG